MYGIQSVIICGGGLSGVSFAACLLKCCKDENIVPPKITILEKSAPKEVFIIGRKKNK